MPATPQRLHRARVAATALLIPLLFGATAASGFDAPKAIPDGWDGSLSFGAEATTGATRTSALSLESALTGRTGRFETAGRVRLLRSEARIEVARERDGEPVLDAAGEPVIDRVNKRTRDRRGVSIEPRWFFTGKHLYAFGLFDYETDRPAGLRSSRREVAGLGYRLWDSKKNYLAAALGAGHKRQEALDGESSDDGIGYLGLRLVLQLTDRAKLDAGLDSDFGGESALSELSVALGYSLTDAASLKFEYEARVNDGVGARDDRDDGGVDGRVSLKLELDVL